MRSTRARAHARTHPIPYVCMLQLLCHKRNKHTISFLQKAGMAATATKGSRKEGSQRDRADQRETKPAEGKRHTFSTENCGEILSSRSSLHTGLSPLALATSHWEQEWKGEPSPRSWWTMKSRELGPSSPLLLLHLCP